MSAQLSPEQIVRKFFDCYTSGRPEDFDHTVAPDYVDYGHDWTAQRQANAHNRRGRTPPEPTGRGPASPV
jgi:hypothetical protein